MNAEMKDTLIGPIPTDWVCEDLEAFTSFISYGFTNPMPTTQSGPHMVTAADVSDGRINFSTARRTSIEAFETKLTSKSKPRKNDVLLTKDGALGRVALVENETICINQSVAILRPNKRIEPSFLSHLLQADLYQKKMLEDAGGSTIKHIYITIVNRMPIAVPESIAEQQAIAAALSDADGVVAGLERVIAKKRLIKQGAMQDLLTARRRLPGFSGEWDQVQLKDFTTHGAGNSNLIKGTLQRSGRTGIYPAYTASGPDLMLDFFEQEGDAIIISAVGSRCGKSFRASGQWSSIANTHVLRCRDGLDIDFAFIFLNNEDFWLKGGTGQPFVLVRRTLEKLFLLPSVDEQKAIAAVFNDMDAEIQAVEARLTKARAVKEGMMQNLLTGRVRLV